MFELDGDFDIDDAFLQDAFQQDSGNLNHSAPENDAGKRTFSEDEQSLCSKRNRVDNLQLLESPFDNKCHESLDCGQILSNRFNVKNSQRAAKPISNSPQKRSSEITTIQSTPDIFGAELPSSAAIDALSSDSIADESNSTLLRDTPSKGGAVADLNHSIRQRKFPGPAGLLPDKQYSILPSKLIGRNSPVSEQPPQEPLCSQRSVAVFEGAPWQKMLQDFGLNKKGSSPLEKFTVSWIRRRAAARQLVGQKVPFLAVVLQSIDCASPDPCLVLRDKTGEIFGTLHRDVWEQHGGQLVLGAVLVLRQAGVLSTGPAARRHYLNITFNNLLTIYEPTENEESVKQTHLHEVSQKELIDAVEEWQASNMRTTKNLASASLPSSGNSSQQVGATLWNVPGSGTHNLSSDRTNSLWLNRPHKEGFSATASRVHNISSASSSSNKVELHIDSQKTKRPSETFVSESNSSQPNRTSTNEVQSGYWPKASLVNVHNSFSPRISQTGASKSSAFNLKMPVSRDVILTPANQSSETLRTCKFTPKAPNNILTPVRPSNEFIPNVPSCSSLNAPEGSSKFSKGSKFTHKISNSIILTPATESLGPPKSSKFTPKMPMVTPCMAPLSSIHNLNSTNPTSGVNRSTKLVANSPFSNNSHKEEELDSILGGLDTSSLFDDDF